MLFLEFSVFQPLTPAREPAAGVLLLAPPLPVSKRRIRHEISRPVRLTGGDSASALRALRNGAPYTGTK